MASSERSVRQYHVPSTRAGDASTCARSSLTRISLNLRPAWTTKVWPRSFVKKILSPTATGDEENPSRIASPSRS